MAARAQQPREGVWLGAQLQVKLSDKWAWHHDAGFRTVKRDFITQQILYRTGARYFVNKNMSFAAGGALFFSRISFDNSNHEFGREFRLWQEAVHQVNSKKIIWQNRFLAEQRFFDETSHQSAFTAFRFRVKTTFTTPLNDSWSLQLSDEYMRQVAHSIFGFDQNRVMLYGLYNINTNTALRGGYMWILLPGRQSRHVLNIGFQKTIENIGRKTKKLIF